MITNIVLHQNPNEKIAQWLRWKWGGERLSLDNGITMIGEGVSYRTWYPDAEIALWHGADGLLAEIEKRGLQRKFYERWLNLKSTYTRCTPWHFRRAEPAQLAAVLVKMIKEENDEQKGSC